MYIYDVEYVRASVPQRLALPASNVTVGSVFNLDF